MKFCLLWLLSDHQSHQITEWMKFLHCPYRPVKRALQAHRSHLRQHSKQYSPTQERRLVWAQTSSKAGQHACCASMSSESHGKAELANCPEEFVALGNRLADAASGITTKYFRSATDVASVEDQGLKLWDKDCQMQHEVTRAMWNSCWIGEILALRVEAEEPNF